MGRRLTPLVLVVCVLGCSRSNDMMPMHVGSSATYEIAYGLEKHVEPVTVSREIPIQGLAGYEVSGPMGVSQLVWKQGELLAAKTTNATFDPPIPILAEDQKDRTWSGQLGAMGAKTAATATLTHKKDKIDLGSKSIDATLAELTIQMPRGTIVLDTWFQPGVGMIQQEQRTGDQLVLRMTMLGSPKN